MVLDGCVAWPARPVARSRSSPRPVASAGRAPRVCPDTPACRWTIDTSRANSAAAATAAALISRAQTAPNRTPTTSCGHSHQQVDAAQQPPVSEADLAPPGGEPQEGQPTDRPLQQHRGGIEADHARQANDPTRASRARARSERARSRPSALGRGSAAGSAARPRVGEAASQKCLQSQNLFDYASRVKILVQLKFRVGGLERVVHHRKSSGGAGSHFVDSHPSRELGGASARRAMPLRRRAPLRTLMATVPAMRGSSLPARSAVRGPTFRRMRQRSCNHRTGHPAQRVLHGQRPSVADDPFPAGSPTGDPCDRPGAPPARHEQRRSLHRRVHRADQVRQRHPTCRSSPSITTGAP